MRHWIALHLVDDGDETHAWSIRCRRRNAVEPGPGDDVLFCETPADSVNQPLNYRGLTCAAVVRSGAEATGERVWVITYTCGSHNHFSPIPMRVLNRVIEHGWGKLKSGCMPITAEQYCQLRAQGSKT